MMDRLALILGLSQVIRTDSGKKFFGRTMLAWSQERGVQLHLIRLC
jgi:hypothetical protein